MGETAWDNHLKYAMNLAIKILSAHRAPVVLFTVPYTSPIAGENPNGVDFVEDQPGASTPITRWSDRWPLNIAGR